MRHAATLLAAALLAAAAAFGASALEPGRAQAAVAAGGRTAAAALGASARDPGRAQAAATVNVRTCTGGKMALKVDEKRMLDLHNQKRRSQELRRLCVHPALQRAARDHSQDMIRDDYFAPGNGGRRPTRQ